uniref:Uncharacterized protein n=1 Tax=Romanomermis culicivorax TaxID=13658 RepID=A0A915JVS5_ROMCU
MDVCIGHGQTAAVIAGKILTNKQKCQMADLFLTPFSPKAIFFYKDIAKACNHLSRELHCPSIQAAIINNSDQTSRCHQSFICAASMDLSSGTICGSDGITYRNLCEMKKRNCANEVHISEQHRGPCSKELKCLYTRSHQLLMKRFTNNSDLFVPECGLNGSFSIVQCHNSTGYCWCSKEDGTPVPGSAMMNKKPNCTNQSKTGRRSSRRQLGAPKSGCGTLDRSYFNSNLIKYFKNEYEDELKKAQKNFGKIKTSQIIEWKFNQLDADRNDKITKKEMKILRKLVKDIIRPMVCAKRLWGHCDTDHNKRVTKSEWFMCLGVDINVSVRLLHSLNPGNKRYNENIPESRVKQAGLDLLTLSASIAASKNEDKNSLIGFPLHERPKTDEKDIAEEDGMLWYISLDKVLEESQKLTPTKAQLVAHIFAAEKSYPDCVTQKSKALRDFQTNPSPSVYIPSCNKQNSTVFERVQCHASTHFCWCVDPLNGKPTPGTSVQFSRPICNRILKDLGEIKECSGRKKRQFFDRLIASITTNMNARGGIGRLENGGKSRTENVINWQFEYLDRNRNKIIDRQEWREFRLSLKSWQGVRKCGRNFLRYCDHNNDRRITSNEWNDCTMRNINFKNDGETNLSCYFCDHSEDFEATDDDRDLKCMTAFRELDDHRRLCVGDEVCFQPVG